MTFRGSNQSVDTKYATTLVAEAVEMIRSGRVEKGVCLVQHALILLPYICHVEQDIAEVSQKKIKRGFAV